MYQYCVYFMSIYHTIIVSNQESLFYIGFISLKSNIKKNCMNFLNFNSIIIIKYLEKLSYFNGKSN